ncbi:MAG TPA: glycosyl hydrolase [Propionibacteriaceae bacterium]|jgi:hypothetical protein
MNDSPRNFSRRRLFQSAAVTSVAVGLGGIAGATATSFGFGLGSLAVASVEGATECTPTPSPSPSPTPVPSTSKNLGAMVFVKQADFARDVAATVAAGFTWIRMDIPIGAYGAVTNGRFVPNAGMVTFYRQAAAQASAAGLKIVLVMAAMYNSNTWSEAQFRDYNSQYVRSVSQSIGSFVDLWQVFNEHDGRDYRNHAPIDLTSAYLARMRDTLAALRSALRQYSTAPVTTTPFGYPVNQARYDKWVKFFDGVGSSLDVICVHAYPEKGQTTINLVPTYMTNLRNRYGKPVGILEFGLPSVTGYGTPTQVGAAVAAQIAAIMTCRPFVATLYQLRDRGVSTTNGELVFGVLRNDWSKKSYYDAVATEVRKWR